MIDIETYHKARELREKGMKRSGIVQELNISKTAYNRYTYLSEDTFLAMYNQFKENDIENYRDFIISILSVTPNIFNTTIYYRAIEEFRDFNVSRSTFFRFIERVRAESGYIRKVSRPHERKPDTPLGYEAQVDFGQYVTKKNEGELPQVYVENAHDAIIDKKAFDLVQIEIERRKGIKHYSGISIFSGKVYCGECGAFFGRKVWHSNDKYRTEVYRCNEKYNGKTCNSGHITEDEIKKIFVDSYNKLPKKKTIEDAEFIKNKQMPTDKELKERDRLIKAVDDTYKKSEELIKLNTIQKQDQKKYNEEYNALVEESNKLNEKLTALENKIKDKESRMSVLAEYINTLKMSKRPLTEFDEGLFAALLDKMIVNKDKVKVVWRDGSTMEVLK